MKSTDSKVLDFNEGIKLELSHGNVLGAKLGNVYEITVSHDIETYLGYLHISFDGSNDGKIEGYFVETHWDMLIVKGLALMKATHWYYLLVKC